MSDMALIEVVLYATISRIVQTVNREAARFSLKGFCIQILHVSSVTHQIYRSVSSPLLTTFTSFAQ
jgi:hypothetical protein